jgi:hypothetical protein
MGKLIITGIWVCIVTLASVYFSIQMASKPVETAPVEDKPELETINGEMVSFPILEDGRVRGYFLTRLTYEVDKAKVAVSPVPLADVLTDVLYTELVGNKIINLTDNREFNLDEFRKTIVETVNKKMGEGTVANVLVQQLDYLTKEDITGEQDPRPVADKNGKPYVVYKPEPPKGKGEAKAAAPAH